MEGDGFAFEITQRRLLEIKDCVRRGEISWVCYVRPLLEII